MDRTYFSMERMNSDKEFVRDLYFLSKVATNNNPLVKQCISRLVELYIEKKIDNELISAFQKIFK